MTPKQFYNLKPGTLLRFSEEGTVLKNRASWLRWSVGFSVFDRLPDVEAVMLIVETETSERSGKARNTSVTVHFTNKDGATGSGKLYQDNEVLKDLEIVEEA